MKNMTFETAKKLGIVVPVRFGKTSKMINHLLQNCDTAVFYDPETSFSSLCQKIGRLTRK